jgi:hypothetical protein
MQKNNGRVLLGGAVAAVMAGVSAEAFAQLEEVVVTAERRETSLQQTPISIGTPSIT